MSMLDRRKRLGKNLNANKNPPQVEVEHHIRPNLLPDAPEGNQPQRHLREEALVLCCRVLSSKIICICQFLL